MQFYKKKSKIVPTNHVVMKPMDPLGCHIKLFTQLVDLLAKDHVETYIIVITNPMDI